MSYHIICGTYEHVLYGYIGAYQEDGSFTLTSNFITQSHLGSIRALALSGKWLLSCSSDETIKAYDLSKNKEIATMSFHDDLIDCLEIYDNYFVSSGKDGKICVWKMKDWDCLKTMRGHTLGVNSFAIHPSGKIGLSCGVDRTLRVWNMINGRAAHDSLLSYTPEHLMWSPNGELYCISSFENVYIYNMEGEKLNTISTDSYKNILAMVFLNDETIAFGGEDREISVYNINGTLITKITGFKNRVKDLAIAPKPNELIQNFPNLLISISSDGSIKVFDLDIGTTPITETTIQNRLICLTASLIDY